MSSIAAPTFVNPDVASASGYNNDIRNAFMEKINSLTLDQLQTQKPISPDRHQTIDLMNDIDWRTVGPNDIPSREETLSDLPWIPSKPRMKENYNRKPEKDRDDEMALREDFERNNPTLDTVKRRAQYREHLDFNCLPESQKHILLTTYGPGPQFDIQAEESGFRVWGSFGNLKECRMAIARIRKLNPHAVFFPIHIVDLDGKPIEFPPPNDGSTENFHLNQEHQMIMSRHLKGEVKSAEYVESRKLSTIEDVAERTKATEAFNKKISGYLSRISTTTKNEKKEKQQEVLKSLKDYSHDDTKEILIPGGQSAPFEMQVENLKCIPSALVQDWIKLDKAHNSSLANGNLSVDYQKYKRADGKWVLVKVISSK